MAPVPPLDDPALAAWYAALCDVVRRGHLMLPDQLPAEVNAALRPLGLEITIYLVDLEQRAMRPIVESGRPGAQVLPVDGTLPGRVFSTVTAVATGEPAGPYRLWLPLVDGSERLGVAEIFTERPPAQPDLLLERCLALVGLIGHLIAAKMPYGDTLRRLRRTRSMSPAGELLLSMLPPLTFTCRDMVVSAILEPSYDVGGDAFDYAVDGLVARLAVFDAMGRGLRAGLTCAVAMAAIRAARRDGHDLVAMTRAADAAITDLFSDFRYVTGVVAELDLETGILRYVNAGHPQPLLMRRGRAVRALTGGRRLPMGIRDDRTDVGSEALERGDRLLLYTDGVVEARGPDGEPFGEQRLVDLAERGANDELPTPETLRRLSHSIQDHQQGPPRDDATMMLTEWSGTAPTRAIP
jgi:phosphoserine phosphatase RsbU/P